MKCHFQFSFLPVALLVLAKEQQPVKLFFKKKNLLLQYFVVRSVHNYSTCTFYLSIETKRRKIEYASAEVYNSLVPELSKSRINLKSPHEIVFIVFDFNQTGPFPEQSPRAHTPCSKSVRSTEFDVKTKLHLFACRRAKLTESL